MVSLIRSGPRILILKTSKLEALKDYLISEFDAVNYNLSHSFEKSTEGSTIIYFTDELDETIRINFAQDTLLIMDEPAVVLCKFYRLARHDLIDDMRPAPDIIIMRAIGNLEWVMAQIQKDFNGEIGIFEDLLDRGNNKNTVVALTEKPLNRSVSINEFYGKALKLEGRHFELLKELRMHALNYLNVGIGNKDWFEIEIRIYDRYSAYKLHYDRLIEVFESLELGFVLGESWSKDYPRFLMSVEVYRVRFFTFKEPNTIKWILLGMEYLADGTRIVDYDVYYNHKKIDWNATLRKEDTPVRHLAGLKSRTEIFSRLTAEAIETLNGLEAEVIKTRT